MLTEDILQSIQIPEGPYVQPLGNKAPKYHTIEGIMDPNPRVVVYVNPLGIQIPLNLREEVESVGALGFVRL